MNTTGGGQALPLRAGHRERAPASRLRKTRRPSTKAAAEPQLCGNVESSHRGHKESLTPCPSENGSNQKRDLQKMGSKIAAAKIFALLF